MDMEEKIVFDTASGFSVEEQREILEEINSLARENRIAAPREALKTAAKKRGLLFPVLVNIAALLFLASGLFLLWHFHNREEADIREGSLVLGLTERKLIQEIRQETSRLIGEKEREIDDYLARLADVNAEYRELEASVESLTEEQIQRAEYLLKVQDEYRGAITGLQEERAKILEDARFREAELRAQAEARVKELSSRIEQSASELTAAQEELSRLSSEQERAARAESQLGAYYQRVNESIKAGELDNATALLGSMKEFVNTPSLQGIRSLENRKRSHLAAIDSLELTVAEALRLREESNSAAGVSSDSSEESDSTKEIDSSGELEALQRQIGTLEDTIRRQQAAIEAFSAQGSETGKLIADYEGRINGLQTQAAEQQQTLNQRDASISALQTQLDGQREQIVEQDRRIVALQGQAENQTRTISNNETTIAELRTRNETLTRANEDLSRQLANIRESARQLLEQ